VDNGGRAAAPLKAPEATVFEVAYETTFCATHVLHQDGRPIEPNHGHDWRVEVVAAGDRLDAIGVVVDFEHLKEATQQVARRLHYQDITTHAHFAGQSPSAEAVARYFFLEVRKAMGEEGEHLRRVRVWEAPGCSATYVA
jgi:6-pyruvoyl-tetrahydropterin synthase